MMNTLAIFGLGTPEIIAILVIVLSAVRSQKTSGIARGLGKSLGEFKKAKSEFEDELLKTEKEAMVRFLRFQAGIQTFSGTFAAH